MQVYLQGAHTPCLVLYVEKMFLGVWLLPVAYFASTRFLHLNHSESLVCVGNQSTLYASTAHATPFNTTTKHLVGIVNALMLQSVKYCFVVIPLLVIDLKIYASVREHLFRAYFLRLHPVRVYVETPYYYMGVGIIAPFYSNALFYMPFINPCESTDVFPDLNLYIITPCPVCPSQSDKKEGFISTFHHFHLYYVVFPMFCAAKRCILFLKSL
jgi:hypothetical protein